MINSSRMEKEKEKNKNLNQHKSFEHNLVQRSHPAMQPNTKLLAKIETLGSGYSESSGNGNDDT